MKKNINYNNILHIDCINGYTQHLNIPEEYNFGFPYITDFRKCDNLEFAISHNGIYLVHI